MHQHSQTLAFFALDVEERKAAHSNLVKGLSTWSDIPNSDLIGIQTNLYKIQLRILSLLPSSDAAWLAWVQLLDQASQK